MTKQLTHAENNKERVLDEARQERERLLEEARQRYERTCREHDQRLHELAKSHDDNCERLCREIVDLTKDNKQLKLALHMVKEEARNRPPPPPPGPTPAQIRKYVFLGAFMVCCGLLLGKLAVDTVIRPQRNVPLPSGYNDNSDLQQRPSSSSRKNLLFAKRRSPLPFSRTKMMQPSRIYEQVLSQEEHNIVEVEQEVKPVAFEDIVNEQQQEQQEVQEPVIPQTKAPLEPVVQETVATAKQQAVVETTPSNVSNDSNSNYHHNHRLVQPEKIHAYVQHWLNVLRQVMIAAEPRMHSIKDFAFRAALKIQSIEWSHGMSQSEWVEIRYKLL
jgi:vacuolar-type H+-ATPase subunit H